MGEVPLLVPLDLSAAFNTLSNGNMYSIQANDFGVTADRYSLHQ